jgi:hypothetical protein
MFSAVWLSKTSRFSFGSFARILFRSLPSFDTTAFLVYTFRISFYTGE